MPGVRSVARDLADYSVTLGSPEQNIACADDGNGGCLCSYDIASEPTGGGLSGRWSTQGALITHFADTQSVPSQADVCVGDDTMTIWGHDRTWIWDQPGLRTITLDADARELSARRRPLALVAAAAAVIGGAGRAAGRRRDARREGAGRRDVAADRRERAAMVDARIAEVTVFSDRARVRRRGRATGKAGIEIVRFPSLPGAVFLDTIRVVGERRPRAARRGDTGRARADVDRAGGQAAGRAGRRRRSSGRDRGPPHGRRLGGRVPARAPPRRRPCPRTSARAARTWSPTRRRGGRRWTSSASARAARATGC